LNVPDVVVLVGDEEHEVALPELLHLGVLLDVRDKVPALKVGACETP